MKNRRHILPTAAITCAAVALLGVGALGQTPPPAPAKDQAPASAATLRVTTRVVQVSVLAQDGNGHPVTGLTQDDFKVLDNGVAQKIVSFSQHSNRLTADVTPGVRPVSANTFSNRVDETTGVPPSITVVLLDALNTDFHDMASARGQVVKFLRTLHPEDRVALYELTTGLIVLHDFTSDTATLLRALSDSPNPQNGAPAPTLQVTAADEAALDVHAKGAIAAPDPGWLAAELARENVFDQTNKVEGTTDAFTQIAHHLARLPGRKNLVWVSGSFPFNVDWDPTTRSESPSFATQINLSAQALSDANVAIYPVDARGLMAQRMGEGGTLFRTTRPSSPPQATLDTMQKLAQGTGGVAYYNTNGIAEAIRHAIDDSSLTYELTYYPTNDNWNGRFRDIKVEVKRSGVHLRYRKGYFATPALPSTPESQARLMTAAARDPLEATQLGLNVQINAVDAPGPRQVKVEVRVDPDQMHFDLNAGKWNDSVEITWVELDSHGDHVGHSAKILTLNYPDEQHDKVLHEGLVFKSTIQMVDTCVELRLVARDGGTGAIGSLNIPLTRIFMKTGTAAAPNP
ncbi:MAG TPA: VWA domain-containing protein [Candidatus Acidoferrales bacterium]